MAAKSDSCRSKREQLLLSYRSKLESALEQCDLQRLYRAKIISEDVKGKFDSLDDEHLDLPDKVRFLFQQIYERVKEDGSVYDRLMGLLLRLGGVVKDMCVAMRFELEGLERGKGWAEGGVWLGERDIHELLERLVSVSYKWEEIGVALGLPESVMIECKVSNSDFLRLNKVLLAWIKQGIHYGAKSPSIDSLCKVLTTLGHSADANALLVNEGSGSSLDLQTKEMNAPILVYQSYDIEVSEGKSTLLEVQVSGNGCESYQWSKDGQPLLDGADFSGVSSNILYINRASQGTEGKYSCTVSNGRETVCSDDIHLNVLKPSFEEVDLVKLSDCLVKYEIISRYVYDKFSSLDHSYLDQDLRFRYLLQQVAESVKEDSKLYDRLDAVVNTLDGILKDLCEAIKTRIGKDKSNLPFKFSAQTEGQYYGVELAENVCLTEEDVSYLVHLLVPGSHMWELLGIALGLPQYVIAATARDFISSSSRLSHILTEWISGSYYGAKPATVNVLKKVLSSELVRLPKLAHSLNEFRKPAETLSATKLQSIEQPPQKQGHSSDKPILDVQVSVKKPITEEDVSFLTEALAETSYKWEEIGIALRLPKHVLINCGREDSLIVKLNNVLTAWASGNHCGTKSATLESLRTALASPLVGLGMSAQKVDSVGMSTKVHAGTSNIPEVISQSFHTEVSEGKSTLLEVQVSGNGCESYQWSKDGQPLLDGADFSGVSSNILYINRASQGTEGKYSCTVSNGRETVCSDIIYLTILFSLEKKRLLDLYSLIVEVPRDSWPPVGPSAFINLALIKTQDHFYNRDYTVRGDMDDILMSKETVTYDDVFSKYREGALVLIEGRPGSGKTTLVHKVTRDWARGREILQGARLVFLVSLRMLVSKCDQNLLDILEFFFPPELLHTTIKGDIEKMGGKGMCFILDGLDEYQYEKKSVIHQLIHKSCLPFAMVIVTSRPIASYEIRRHCSLQIEIMGFTMAQVYHYIDSYPFTTSSRKLIDYLENHPNVLHMCYLPVHAAMICYLYDRLEDNLPQTETKIYEHFTMSTLIRHFSCDADFIRLQSLNDLSGHDLSSFRLICKLAFDMTCNSKQVVSESDVSIPFSNISSSVLSLLTVEQVPMIYGLDRLYSFHHLTFQEYFAATYIAMLSEDEQRQIIAEFGRRDQFMMIWKFFFGLVHWTDRLLDDEKVIQKLFGVASEISTYQVQCAFESQHTEVCEYFVKKGSLIFKNEFIRSSDLVALGYVLSTAPERPVSVVFDCCKWYRQGGDSFLPRSADEVKSVKSLKYISASKSNEDFVTLNELLFFFPHLRELGLQCNKLDPSDMMCLTRNVTLPHLQVLKIRLSLKACSYPQAVLRLLKLGSHSIKDVYFSFEANFGQSSTGNKISLWRKWLFYAFEFQVFVDSDISWVCLYNSDTFSSLSPEVFSCCTEVVLANCGIDDEGVELLASSLNTSVLENIVLDFNRICESGAVALAGCMSRCSVLQEVCMECNFIGDLGATALASALVDCSSLRRLDLQGNAISDEGAVTLAKAAEDKPHLDLYLHNVNITEEGVKKVLELGGRTKINNMEFSLSWDAISEAGIDDLRRALKCGSLPALKISDNNINIITNLVDELDHLKSIRSVQCDEVTDDTLPSLVDVLRSIGCLQSIDIGFVAVSVVTSAMLGDLLKKVSKSMLRLSLRNMEDKSFTHANVLDGIRSMVNLELLELPAYYLGSQGIASLFSNFESWVNLQILHLPHNRIGSNGAEVLSKILMHCRNLCGLDLSYNNIGDTGAIALAGGLQNHTRLLEVRLGENNISTKGIQPWISILNHNSLRHLDLSNCGVCSTIMSIIRAGTLHTLKLGLNNLLFEDEKSLYDSLKCCKQLVELSIPCNNISSQGMLHLAEGLQYCINLQVLDLGHNTITSDDVDAIGIILKACKYLQWLDLSFNKIDVTGAAAIVSNWAHKTVLCISLEFSLGDPHVSMLKTQAKCCSSCDHLWELYQQNDYIWLQVDDGILLPKRASKS